MPNTDFGSNVRSPGGWGGTSGNSAMGGMGSQKASTYNYNQMGPGKIGNFNTGGARVGTGNQFGVNRDTGMASGPWPGGYATPVLKRPVLSPVPPVAAPPEVNPVVAALARRPAVTQEDTPFQPSASPAPQGTPGASGYYDMREALGYQPNPRALSWPPGSTGHGSTWRASYQPAANQTVNKSASTGKQFTDRVPAPSWGDSGSFGYGGRR